MKCEVLINVCKNIQFTVANVWNALHTATILQSSVKMVICIMPTPKKRIECLKACGTNEGSLLWLESTRCEHWGKKRRKKQGRESTKTNQFEKCHDKP